MQAIPSLPAWFSWSKVTAPSFAGSVILPLGRYSAGPAVAAGCVAAGFSACVVGGGAEVAAAGGGGACGSVACGLTGAAVPAGCGRTVVGATGGEATAARSRAATPGVGEAG